MPTCIDLAERFGQRYRVEYEESYFAQYGPRARTNDPWLQIIPGARGHVYPWNTTTLAATTKTSGRIAKQLKALPFVEVYTDACDGATVLFPAGHLDQVADLLRLRRRRRLSDRERNRLAELGRRYGFQPRQHGFQSSSETRPCVPTPRVDVLDQSR